MNKEICQNYLDCIIKALLACHNTVTTDKPGVHPDETSWRINNSKEIQMVEDISKYLAQ